MIDEEAEYRKVFLYQKHWQRNSAHREHSSTQYLIEPAKATLNYINSIDTKDKSYKTKLDYWIPISLSKIVSLKALIRTMITIILTSKLTKRLMNPYQKVSQSSFLKYATDF